MTESEIYHLRCFSNLLGFRSEKKLTVADFQIRKFTRDDNEQIKWMIQEDLVGMLGIHFLNAVNDIDFIQESNFAFIVEFPYKLKSTGVLDITPCKESISRLITCLRLFKPGRVGTRSIKVKIVEGPCYKGAVLGGSISLDAWMGSMYYLSDNETMSFEKFFYKNYKRLLTSPFSVKRAIRWFNKAYTERNLEDRLIEFICSIESLYRSTGYRLSLRCAYNLSQCGDERESIAKDVKTAYHLRSKLVHGSKIRQSDLGKLDPKIEDYTRRSIIKFIESKDHKYLLNNLEKRIFRSQD